MFLGEGRRSFCERIASCGQTVARGVPPRRQVHSRLRRDHSYGRRHCTSTLRVRSFRRSTGRPIVLPLRMEIGRSSDRKPPPPSEAAAATVIRRRRPSGIDLSLSFSFGRDNPHVHLLGSRATPREKVAIAEIGGR